MPIHQTSAYVFEDADHAADLFDLNRFGNIYTRIMNPTTAVFEERMASLEGGVGALATASGLAAQSMAFMTLLDAGDHVVSSAYLYGGSHNQLAMTLARFGIETTFVDPADHGAWREAVTPARACCSARPSATPGSTCSTSPRSRRWRTRPACCLIDSTFATPYLCRPAEHGAHLVSHSATKWICGHGTTIGGVLVDAGTFPWADGRFPGLVEPSPATADALRRDVRELLVHHEGARGDHARPRAGDVALQRLPAAAGPRDPVPAHGPPRRQRPGGRGVPLRAPRRRMGRLPRPARQPVPTSPSATCAAPRPS